MKTTIFDRQIDKQHYNSIDLVKGICIIFVIITHYKWDKYERLKFCFPFWIDMAVPVFMIISGFVYTKSFAKKQISNLDEAYAIDTLISKIIRYSIPFLIIFIFEEIVFIRIDMVQQSMFQVVVAFINGGIGRGSYYYPIMMQFIFFFPLVYELVRKRGFCGVIICGFINFVYELLKFSYGMNEECYRLLIFRYTLLISYGCWLAMDDYVRHHKVAAVCFICGFSYIVFYKYLGFQPTITQYWTGTSFLACLFIIPLSAPLILNKFRCYVLEVIGKASYNIFLVQMVYYNYAGVMYSQVESRLLQILINILFCVIVGILFYCFETPITKKIRQILYHFIATFELNNKRKGNEFGR